MKHKGFSLIELIAVIAIIAILAIVAVPYISDVIEGSKESSYLNSCRNVIRAVKLDYESNGFTPKIYYFPDSQLLISEEDTFTGYVQIDIDEKVEMMLDNGKYCAFKAFDGDIVVKKSGECDSYIPAE